MITETWVLVKRELEKWYKVPALIFSALIQPIVWITLFGNSFNPTRLMSFENLTFSENIPPEVSVCLGSPFPFIRFPFPFPFPPCPFRR